MAYTEKFQSLADEAQAKVESVAPDAVDALMAAGAVALDIRDKEEHDAGHIPGSLHISRGKLEMNVEAACPIWTKRSCAIAMPSTVVRSRRPPCKPWATRMPGSSPVG